MNKNIIIPLYVYHYKDPSSDNYYGLIDYNDNISSELYKGWFLYSIIYVFSPFLRPIPEGTKLFNLKFKNYFPYDIKEYKLVYDIFSINMKDEFSVNFITYNRPVTNVKPLYFHELNGGIFPSFDIIPPNSNPNWTLPNVNPIFVMTKIDQKFYCDNGRCLPSPMIKNHFHQTGILGDDENLEIDNCLSNCGYSIGILETVKNIKNNINKNIEPKKSMMIISLIISFIIIFIIIFIILYKRK